MSYHIHHLEEYQFSHGLHRVLTTGKYIALHPHLLGRPLTHEEMDYNLVYTEQTLAGFRIFGSNADLSLSDDDLGKSLLFHKIASSDADFARYTSAGYTEGQYIWIPDCCGTQVDCSTFQVVSISAIDSGGQDDCISFTVDNIVATDSDGSENVVTPTPTATQNVTPTPTVASAPPAITPTPTATSVPVVTPTPTSNQGTSNLTFDYHVPLTVDGRTYELQRPGGVAYSYSEDVSWTVNNPIYWGHEIFAEPFAGHEWTSTDQLTFTVDGNEITPDGTIQNNISIVTTVESDGRLSILTKSHNINESRVHEIIITGGPELVDSSVTIDTNIQYPWLPLSEFTDWETLVDGWEAANPNCSYYPDFDHNTGSFLQTKLGVSNTEMFSWGLSSSHKKRFMLNLLSEQQPLDLALLEEYKIDQGC